MKLLASAVKSLRETVRDWKVLILILFFAPFFILLMYLFYGSTGTTYKIGIVNADGGAHSVELTEALSNMKGIDASMAIKIICYKSPEELRAAVKEKSADIGLEIPAGYSERLAGASGGEPAAVNYYGSMGNMNYTVAAILVSDVVYQQGLEAVNMTMPTAVNETFLEKKQSLSGFDTYVPGGISLAVLMLLFSACAAVVRENDKKTLLRLKLSRLGSFHFLAGISIVQAVLGTASIVLSFLSAMALGYRPAGGFGPVLVIGLLSSLSMVAVSLVLASFLNTIFDVLTIGCFPFFIFAFFTGAMFPIPKTTMFTFFGHSFGITDLLPLTHTVNAFNKILNDGAHVSDIAYELGMILLLTVVYFGIGLALYKKRKLSKA